ncbi:response regulator receiver protein [Stenotrophomonas ginsengisoli]|uniref:Response regulator receiver protein n=1 Tax=Stenotrophomonas ginsengisoli TaxID=336566 RepID=A0A0R0D3C5_9GAMM|nr:EAL domain-containing response regulator [Stenotrophomonas ginsengisoli]KRG76604.1 response regulator receiver protein [Stenotrophomonas ginsengisoli]
MAKHDTPSRPVRAETPPADYAQRWNNAPATAGIATAAQESAATPASAEAPAAIASSINPPELPPAMPAAPMAAPAPAPVLAPATPAPAATPALADVTATPFRVLVVEDDRSQALFAQSVLHGAGIEAVVENDPFAVLTRLPEIKPDLILMDLHLREMDGIALTQKIRQQPHLQLLPIVFLSGDPDPERQYEVLAIGADDFLAKPIRPRHLIAAVSNRIARARQQAMALGLAHPPVAIAVDSAPPARPNTNPETGLPTRQFVLGQLDTLLAEKRSGGLLFVEVAGAIGLRERYGYAHFERLMVKAGHLLLGAARPHSLARLNDNSFLVLAPGVEPVQLVSLAQTLRDGLASEALPAGQSDHIKLRASVGYAPLDAGFADASQAIDAVERTTLDARLLPGAVAQWQPRPTPSQQEHLKLLEGHLEPAYQPIVAVADSSSAQFQVLLRLRQADGTLLPAAQVIPAAEAAGRIADLDHQVMEHALDLLDRYRHATLPMRLFVTQSARTLMADGYAEWISQALRSRNVGGSSVVIDIRMPDALVHGFVLAQLADRLGQSGIRLCLSQFEACNDANALLTMMPVAYVRLSARFASDHADPQVRQLLASTMELARSVNAQLIAQQIEDAQAAAAMWISGIDYIQGNMVQSVGNDLDFDFHNSTL